MIPGKGSRCQASIAPGADTKCDLVNFDLQDKKYGRMGAHFMPRQAHSGNMKEKSWTGCANPSAARIDTGTGQINL
jgi:hypothetical protein